MRSWSHRDGPDLDPFNREERLVETEVSTVCLGIMGGWIGC